MEDEEEEEKKSVVVSSLDVNLSENRFSSRG